VSEDEALATLSSTDWSDAEVDTQDRAASVVFSFRVPADLSAAIVAAAEARGLRPGTWLRELIEDAVARQPREDETVTVRVADLHRAIDTIVRRAA
jgi:hypothetical protein